MIILLGIVGWLVAAGISYYINKQIKMQKFPWWNWDDVRICMVISVVLPFISTLLMLIVFSDSPKTKPPKWL